MARVTDGSVVFEVKRVLDGTANKAEAAILLGGKGYTSFANKTIGELKSFILNKLDSANIQNKEGLFISFSIGGSLYDVANHMNDDSYVIRPGGQIGFFLTSTTTYANKYFHIKMSSYGYQSYEFGVINGVFEKPRPIVYTLDNGNNTNKITVDRLEGTADKSLTADKSFRLYPLANQFIKTTNEKIDNTGMQVKIVQSSAITDGTYPGANGYILQFAISEGSNYQVQLMIPDNRGNRLKIRCQHGYSDWSGSVWQEIPLAHEVVTLKGNNIITGTIQAKTQATSDSSDNVATTQFVKNAIAEALKAKG